MLQEEEREKRRIRERTGKMESPRVVGEKWQNSKKVVLPSLQVLQPMHLRCPQKHLKVKPVNPKRAAVNLGAAVQESQLVSGPSLHGALQHPDCVKEKSSETFFRIIISKLVRDSQNVISTRSPGPSALNKAEEGQLRLVGKEH
jgi:hypothetical protein